MNGIEFDGIIKFSKPRNDLYFVRSKKWPQLSKKGKFCKLHKKASTLNRSFIGITFPDHILLSNIRNCCIHSYKCVFEDLHKRQSD